MPYEISDREREALREADRINSILSQSNIKQATEAAFLRTRDQQRARELNRARSSRLEDTALELGLKYGGDRFQGTSMEAQMLNIFNDPSIPDDDPRKVQAQRYLSRPTTYSVGDTTFVRQGVLGDPDDGTPKVRPEQRAAAAAVELGDANAASAAAAGVTGDREANWWDMTVNAVGAIPLVDLSFMQTDAWRNQEAAAEAWTETYAKTVKGGGQVTDDDRKQVRETYWPNEADDTAQIALKAQLRRNVENQARKTAQGVRDSADLSVEELLEIY